jgi:hypothetical protein
MRREGNSAAWRNRGHGYSSFDRNTNGGVGHRAGETNGF